MEIIRNETDYALRALVHLALRQMQGKHQPLSARALARAEEIPDQFAYKVLQRLSRSGLVEGRMGSQGGFTLRLDPAAVTLLMVVEAMQGPVAVRNCILGIESCSRRPTCAVTARLQTIREDLVKSMQRVTLADMLDARYKQGGAGPDGDSATHEEVEA